MADRLAWFAVDSRTSSALVPDAWQPEVDAACRDAIGGDFNGLEQFVQRRLTVTTAQDFQLEGFGRIFYRTPAGAWSMHLRP